MAWAIAGTGLLAISYVAWDYWRVSQLYLDPAQRHPAYRSDVFRSVSSTWLYQDYVRFAELGVTPLTQANAAHIHALAKDMLHFSPEPRVVQAVIDSALLLGKDEDAVFYLERLMLAYPQDASAWKASHEASSVQSMSQGKL